MMRKCSLHLLDAWGSGSPSELAVAIDERQKSGLPLFDLVNTSVQKEGFEFDQDLLAECMAEGVKKSRYYVPHAQGNPEARAAVAGYHGHDCSPDDIILTPGSSLAYYYAFRLLANPGEEILCPQPTYPLFDDLAFSCNAPYLGASQHFIPRKSDHIHSLADAVRYSRFTFQAEG